MQRKIGKNSTIELENMKSVIIKAGHFSIDVKKNKVILKPFRITNIDRKHYQNQVKISIFTNNPSY